MSENLLVLQLARTSASFRQDGLITTAHLLERAKERIEALEKAVSVARLTSSKRGQAMIDAALTPTSISKG